MNAGVRYLVSILSIESHQQTSVEDSVFRVTLNSAKRLSTNGEQPCCQIHIGFEKSDDTTNVLKLTNLGELEFTVGTRSLRRGESVEITLPFNLVWEQNSLTVAVPMPERTVQKQSKPSFLEKGSQTSFVETDPNWIVVEQQLRRSVSKETLTKWFLSLANVQRQSACTDVFLSAAVCAMVDPGGLDAGMLLLREGEDWTIRCSHFACRFSRAGTSFEPHFADLVWRTRESLVCEQHVDNRSQSYVETATLYGAPLFDADMNVIGVLYGVRHQNGSNRRRKIRSLESLWLQVLSEAITAGVVRLGHELKSTKQKLLLEQAFPKEVVSWLTQQSSMDLPADEREITVLFADLVDSSFLCENHSPQLVFEFLSDVMEAMTAAIYRHGGLIVDYYGDGLIAMWNAPVDQSNHAELACRAGLAIQKELTTLNAVWSYRLNQRVEVGVGIHTGIAIVGNSGSRDRIKYGPRGTAVNVANRIEKATRRLKQSVLISDATCQRLSADVPAYRLGRFKLWGMEQPIVIHALHSMEFANATNPCCVLKHHEVGKAIAEGNFVEAANQLDDCRGCTFDDLSLQMIQQHLESLSEETGVTGSCSGKRVQEPVFDLTK